MKQNILQVHALQSFSSFSFVLHFAGASLHQNSKAVIKIRRNSQWNDGDGGGRGNDAVLARVCVCWCGNGHLIQLVCCGSAFSFNWNL